MLTVLDAIREILVGLTLATLGLPQLVLGLIVGYWLGRRRERNLLWK